MSRRSSEYIFYIRIIIVIAIACKRSSKPRTVVIFAFCPANVFKPDKMVMQTYVQVIITIVNIVTVNNVVTGGQAKGQPKWSV